MPGNHSQFLSQSWSYATSSEMGENLDKNEGKRRCMYLVRWIMSVLTPAPQCSTNGDLNKESYLKAPSSAVHAADNLDKRQQHNTTHTSTTTDVADPPPLNIHSTHQTPTQLPTVTAHENIIQANQ
ncbi:hypothetical protein Tco_1335494 [Tanacetum coccineum]